MPGEVDVTLFSPNGAEGATLIEFVGALNDVQPSPGVLVFSEVGGGATRVVAIRQGAGPIEFRMFVPDVGRPPEATILQVAAPDNSKRADLGQYRLQYRRVEQ